MLRTGYSSRRIFVFVLALVVLMSGVVACKPEGAETKALPEADMETAVDADHSAFLGVWALDSTLADNGSAADLNAGETERIVLTQDNRIYRLVYREDGALDSKEIEIYDFSDGTVSSEALPFDVEENQEVKWQIRGKQLISSVWSDGKSISDLAEYSQIDLTVDAVIFEQVTVDFEPAKAGSITYQQFDSPVVEDSKPIYEVLDSKPVWVLIGLADNPNKVEVPDEETDFKLSDFDNMAYTVVFYRDGKLVIHGDIYGVTGKEESTYKVIDTHYCDQTPDGDGAGFRFYLGEDGWLYACYYYSEGFLNAEVTDFMVLKPLE